MHTNIVVGVCHFLNESIRTRYTCYRKVKKIMTEYNGYHFFDCFLIGPADYSPEKALNLEHKSYFSFGNRKPLHMPRDTPGNGVN